MEDYQLIVETFDEAFYEKIKEIKVDEMEDHQILLNEGLLQICRQVEEMEEMAQMEEI